MLEFLHSLNQIAASLLTVALIQAAAIGLGATILFELRLMPQGIVARATWAATLGLVTGGLVLALLGFAGVLFRPLIGLVTLISAAWGLFLIYNGWLLRPVTAEADDALSKDSLPSMLQPPRWLIFGLAALAAVVGVTSLVSALAPPTAGDALCYHLELPKAFLADHRLSYLPYHDNSTFPLLGEMWLLWGLALEGPVTAQLLCWCCGWLLAGATVVLAQPLVGRSWAAVAGLATVLVPGINNHMSAPLVDVPTALLTTLTLAAWLRAQESDDEDNWTIVAGVLLGAACGTKYVALVWGAAWCAVVAYQAWRKSEGRRELVKQAAIVAVIAVSVGGMWYVRAAYYRGNPIFPFLSAWLPGSIPPPETVDKTALGFHPWHLLSAPWQVSLNWESFGGRGHRLGVLFLMLLPALCTARKLRGLTPICLLALLYCAGWYLLRQNVRFLIPVVPLLLVAGVWSLIELGRWPTLPRRLAWALLGLVIALDALGPVRRAGANLAVACGWQSRDDFLLKHEPTYRAACLANTMLSEEARILSQDYRAFYFDAHITRESIFRRATHYEQALRAPHLAQELRKRGFTHLLLVKKTGSPAAESTALNQLVAEAQREEPRTGRRLACLDEYDFVDSDGVRRNYQLIELR